MAISIPGYTLVRKVGQGGSAEVYLAVQENLNRRVALKIVKSGLTADPKFGERFKREGRIVAQLNHLHITPVYDIGEYDDHYYMAMEYLSGGDLRARAQHMSLGEMLRAMQQILLALDIAHEHGFIHRDIKPANILFRKTGEAVLTDFGIARQSESLTQMTMTGALLGTPAYMSPEQIAGRAIDRRTDLYAMGITLFEMLSGYQPYRGESVMNVAMQHVNAEIPSLPKTTALFQSLIESVLVKDPDARIADAKVFADSLQTLAKHPTLSVDSPLTSLWPASIPAAGDTLAYPAVKKTVSRKQSMAGIGIGVAAAIIVAAFGGWFMLNQADNPPLTAEADTNTPTITTPMENPWQEKIDQAKALFDQNQFIEPANNNALALYREVLQDDQNNNLALEGEAAILRRLGTEIDELINANQLPEANNRLAQLRALWPQAERVQQLDQRLASEQSRQDERARLAERNQAINQWLQMAETAMLDNRLLKPDTESAWYYFQQVLNVAPKNSSATNGIDRLITRLLSQAQTQIQANDFDQAQTLLQEIREIDPDQARLTALDTQLQDAKRAYTQQQEMARAQAQLQQQIRFLGEQETAWRNADQDLPTSSQIGTRLLQDVEQLLASHPDNTQLEVLQTSVNSRLADIQEQLQTEGNKRKVPAIGF
jgi:serine/threonine-protein kinase PpkA